MLILPIHISKEKIMLIFSIILTILAVIAIFNIVSSKEKPDIEDKFKIENTEKGRLDFIASLGWTADVNTQTKEEITVPKEFDKQYKSYESIQNTMGLSLLPYKDKKLTKYTYKITNHPYSDKMIVYINLFVYQNNIVAGDINSPNFRQGFIENFLKDD